MAKVRPIIPGHEPNSDRDPPPKRGNPRPRERNEIYRQIGEAIVSEWQSAVGAQRALNREHLEAVISRHLRLDEDGKRVEIGIIVDPRPQPDRKFVWIVIPYPDAPPDETETSWADYYASSDKLKTELGEAILFGCGR